MKSAIRSRTAVILASLIAGISSANAATPVTVDSWRYIAGPGDLHVYICERSDCVRIICYFEQPNSAPIPGVIRKQEALVSAMLGEQGKAYSPLAAVLTTGRMHSIATASDGSRAYYALGGVDGPKWRASLSSLSSDAKMSEANLEQ